MEGLTRLVSESLARHGFDRPLDYRRLHWSSWFRCESHHSLLFVPSKPGVFALAEEIIHVGADALVHPERSEAQPLWDRASDPVVPSEAPPDFAANSTTSARRMLAVTQFFEDDDMAFVLDRMLSQQNPMRSRLMSGRYFVRFVVIEDQTQRRTICSALNQWMLSTAEKATGIGSHFATSLELTSATEYVPPSMDPQPVLFENAGNEDADVAQAPSPAIVSEAQSPITGCSTTFRLQVPPVIDPATAHAAAPQLNSGAASNIHSPTPFPSGF